MSTAATATKSLTSTDTVQEKIGPFESLFEEGGLPTLICLAPDWSPDVEETKTTNRTTVAGDAWAQVISWSED